MDKGGWLRHIIEQFVQYKIFANIVIAVTVIAGLVSLAGMNHSFFPEQEMRNIIIQVAYPGASPEEMEEGVTLKIENAIRNIQGIDKLYSTSSENSARITVETLRGFDVDDIYTEIKNAIDRIISFPVSAERPIIFKQKPFSFAMFMIIYGDVDLKKLKSMAEDVKDDLLASGLMSQINIQGIPELEISIELSEENLQRFNITFDQVANAVRFNNRDISGGSIKATSEEILIRGRAKRTEAQKIGEIVLRANEDGSEVLLRDVAAINEQFQDVPNKLMINNVQAISIGVEKLPQEDLKAISAWAKDYVEKYNQDNESVTLEISYDFNEMLGQRIRMLMENGGLGLVLVLVSLGLFLSVRLSLWVAWGIPASFLGMFVIGSMIGITVNMMSLFGMILVVGILVDDGIVIAENIFTHFEKGKNPYHAAVDGTLEVIPAVFTSVITTIIAFSPVLLVSGPLEFLYEMAVVVVASLGFSLLEAFFVLPAHLGTPHVLRSKNRSSNIRKVLNAAINFAKLNIYGRILKLTMKYRAVSLAILIAMFPIVSGLLGGGFIKAIFFPDIPPPFINVDIAFKAGTREQFTEKILEQIDQQVWEVNDELKQKFQDQEGYLNHTFVVLGSNSGGDVGGHAGMIQVFYKELDQDVSTPMLEQAIREKVGDIPGTEKLNIGGISQFGKPVSIRLTGKNNQQIEQAKEYLLAELKQIKILKEVNDDNKVGKRELELDLTPRAYFLGLSHNDIINQIRQGFFGEEVQRLQKGINEVRVWVRYPNTGRLNVGQLDEMKIKAGEKDYPVGEMVTYRVVRGISNINHYAATRTITVSANLTSPDEDIGAVMAKVNSEIIPAMNQRFPSVNIALGGQAEEGQKAAVEIMTYFGLAFLAMFTVVMVAFRSFYQAVLILLMIPFGFLGAILGHGVQGIPVSMLSAWGMVALSGVIINDAVVFLFKFNTNVKEGMSVYDGAYDAGLARFRPIILTSITTVLGLFPLLAEKSYQAQFLIPMATSVAYGVLFGTLIILLFFPVLILVFNDVLRYSKWLWTGKKPTREAVEKVTTDAEIRKLFEMTQYEVEHRDSKKSEAGQEKD